MLRDSRPVVDAPGASASRISRPRPCPKPPPAPPPWISPASPASCAPTARSTPSSRRTRCCSPTWRSKGRRRAGGWRPCSGPTSTPERARANLRQRLFRLRKAVGRELLEGGDVAGLCADIEVRLDPAAAEPGELLHGLAEPVSGELADWLVGAREQRRAGRIRAVADASARLEAAGQLVAALAAAERLLAARPDLGARPSPPDAPALPARRPRRRPGRVRPLLRRARADPRRRPRRRDRGAARPRRRQQPAGGAGAAAAAAGERAAPAAPDRPRRRVAAPARRLVGRPPEPASPARPASARPGW